MRCPPFSGSHLRRPQRADCSWKPLNRSCAGILSAQEGELSPSPKQNDELRSQPQCVTSPLPSHSGLSVSTPCLALPGHSGYISTSKPLQQPGCLDPHLEWDA